MWISQFMLVIAYKKKLHFDHFRKQTAKFVAIYP